MIGSSIFATLLFGQLRRVVDLEHLPVGRRHAIQHARRGRHEIHVELALEPLLDDLHVQQSEEAAAESKSERRRRFGLEEKRRVVQPQLLERFAQLGVLMALDRIQAREDHRLQLFEAGKRFGRRPVRFGDRVADLGVADGLDVRDDEADFARPELVDGLRLRRKDAELIDLVVLPLRHQADLRALAQRAVEHLATMTTPRYGSYHESKISAFSGADGSPFGGGRRWTTASSTSVMPMPSFALVRMAPDPSRPMISSICRRASSGSRAGQIDLVDDRDDLEIVLDSEVGVRERLRFDALRRVDHQQRAFARGERSRDFVGEIDVARRVDQIEDVGLPVLRRVVQPDSVRLDRDAALALEIHRVEHLRLHLAGLQRAGHLEKTIGQRRLAVIDVRDDGEVTYTLGIHARLRLWAWV